MKIKVNTFFPEGWLKSAASNQKNMLTPSALAQAAATGEILEAPCLMCDAHHNLIVDLGCMRGIIPREEGAIGITEGIVRDIALISRVGKAVSFVVTGVKSDENGRLYATLSRRRAQEKCRDEFLALLTPGDIMGARITHLETFGAFCDIGCGIVALLPIDAISVSRIAHPRDRFSVGEDIRVIIKGIAPDGKITLTHKELLGTWQQNADDFTQGQTVSGVVRSVEDYGIFVELTPNLAGLAELKNGVRVGQQASVYIKNIIPEKMKVKLIVIDSFDTAVPPPIKYFYLEKRIDRWEYSPEGAHRKIFTEF